MTVSRVGSSTVWSLLQYGGGRAVTFVSTMVLARFLTPSAFGLVALALLAIQVLDRVKDLGVGQSLVQDPRPWRRIAPTGAVLTVVTAVLAAVLAWSTAGYAAAILGDAQLAPLIRGLSAWLFVSGLAVFPDAALRRALAFKERTVPELGGILVKAIISIGLAVLGAGAWSLVWGQVAASVVTTAGYWWVYRSVRDRDIPILGWSRPDVGALLRGGAALSWVGLLSLVLDNIDYFVIGRRLGSEQLGYYTMAFRLPELLVVGVCAVVSQVLFSSFSRLQHDIVAIREHFLRSTTLVVGVAVPIALGLAAASRQIVDVVFGDQYLPSAPILVFLGIYSALYSLSFTSGDVYKATGRAGILINLSLAKLVVFAPVLWWASGRSAVAVAVALAGLHAVFAVVRLALIHRVLRLTVRDQWACLWPATLSGALMAVVVYLVGAGLSGMPGVVTLTLQILVGMLVYVALLRLTDRPTLADLAHFAGLPERSAAGRFVRPAHTPRHARRTP